VPSPRPERLAGGGGGMVAVEGPYG
jgi:hypothetical protein